MPADEDKMEVDEMFHKRTQIDQLAGDCFSPLAAQHGWTQLSPKKTVGLTSYLYVLTSKLGLEVSLDFYDEYVEVYWVKLKKGKRPRDNGNISSTDERIRMPVWYLLVKVLQVQDEWLRTKWQDIEIWVAPQRRGYTYAEDTLTILMEVVEHYLNLFLQLPDDVLFARR